MNTDTAVIPGGCTGLVQAPDVSWNKPFKAAVRTQYEDWLAQEDKPLTKGTKPEGAFQGHRCPLDQERMGDPQAGDDPEKLQSLRHHQQPRQQ